MRFLPIHIDTENLRVLVIGGGQAAEAKLRTIMRTSAKVTVAAQSVSAEIQRWADEGRLAVVNGTIADIDWAQYQIAYIATNNAEQNSRLARKARSAGILVNTADQKKDSDFYSPAIVDRAPVVISIGTGGTSPGLARAIKADIERRLPARLGEFAKRLSKFRDMLASKMPDFKDRQKYWSKTHKNNDLYSYVNLDLSRMESELSMFDGPNTELNAGEVLLVGAGPGDPDLLTIAAQRALGSADVVVYDRLVSDEILQIARREAKFIYVGKTPGIPSVKQAEISQILVDEARNGHSVVRLKGGNPLIFGRADEEVETLVEAGVRFRIMPGITSAVAAAASAGVSLTSRGKNKSLTLITGHDTQGYAEHDWRRLAKPGQRAAVYMGLGAARFIQGRLLVHGAAADKPVTIVENASCQNEKIVQTDLGSMAQALIDSEISGPAILLIGYQSRATKKNARLLKEAV